MKFVMRLLREMDHLKILLFSDQGEIEIGVWNVQVFARFQWEESEA